MFLGSYFQHKKMEEKRINIINYVSRYVHNCMSHRKAQFFHYYVVEVRCRHEISLEISNDI